MTHILQRSARIAWIGLTALLTACAVETPSNPLLGNWVIDIPTTPRAHGNRIGFREGCVIVSGNRFDSRIANPITYLEQGNEMFVWYRSAARTKTPRPSEAARVVFITPDRIQMFWPEGFNADYMREVGTRFSNRDC